ncbi:hypothetical protein Bealeia2_02077 (plasmid) [Candidatus Bealeia paramacronuclearis]|nr:hypothetical protein [Candidatus Bealeia paramacronuclearis]
MRTLRRWKKRVALFPKEQREDKDVILYLPCAPSCSRTEKIDRKRFAMLVFPIRSTAGFGKTKTSP